MSGTTPDVSAYADQRPQKYYFLFVALAIFVIIVNLRLQNSRIGRAWVAIREDEIAAKACGINTRNIKLLAFAMGASFGGVAGGLFAGFQGFVSPESFSLMESIMVLCMVVLGGMGHIPGVILGGLLLTVLPEVVPPRRRAGADGAVRQDAARSGSAAHAALRPGAGARHALQPAGLWPSPERSANSQGEAADEPKRCSKRRRSPSTSAASRRCSDVSLTIRAGRDLRPDRPERRRQDDLLQRAHRPLHPRWRRLRLRRRSRCSADAPHQVAERGIARTFQNIRLFGNMTALENVMVGRHVRTDAGVLGADVPEPRRRAPKKRRSASAPRNCCTTSASTTAPTTWPSNLSYGDQRRLEIARALATEPKLLALDEPAAGMNATETEELRDLIEGIRGDGMTVLLIEHDVKLVMGLCDRVAVLDYGEKIAEDVPAVVQKDQRVIEAYLERCLKLPDSASPTAAFRPCAASPSTSTKARWSR